MLRPSFHIGISFTSIFALYGAILSTLTAVIQLSNHLKDQGRVALKVRKNMTPIGAGHRYSGMTMVIITATNVGRRPLTIAGFGAKLLFGKGKETDWYLPDVRPPTPHEITEGREIAAYLNQADVDLGIIAYWYAWDSTGRHFRLNVAPWHKRWVSAYRYKHAREST